MIKIWRYIKGKFGEKKRLRAQLEQRKRIIADHDRERTMWKNDLEYCGKVSLRNSELEEDYKALSVISKEMLEKKNEEINKLNRQIRKLRNQLKLSGVKLVD